MEWQTVSDWWHWQNMTDLKELTEFPELTELTALSGWDSIDWTDHIDRTDHHDRVGRHSLKLTGLTELFWWQQNLNDLLGKQLIINKPTGYRCPFRLFIYWSQVYLLVVIKLRLIDKVPWLSSVYLTHSFVDVPSLTPPPPALPYNSSPCRRTNKTKNSDLLLSLHNHPSAHCSTNV